MSLNKKLGAIQNSKSIHNVGAEVRVNILRPVLAEALTVPRPVGEVAHHLRAKGRLYESLGVAVTFYW